MAVISLDGCLTRHDEAGVSFASSEDQVQFRAAIRDADATVMGRRTFEPEQERILAAVQADAASPAAGRALLRIVMTRTPLRYVSHELPGHLEFTDAAPDAVLDSLAARGYESVLILGGAEIFDLFVASRRLTEWRVTVEPRLLGSGTRLLAAPTDQRLVLVEHRLLNEDTVFLRYRPV